MGCNPLACVFGKCVIPQRYVLAFMILMGILNAYGMRVCLSIALTEMVAVPQKDNSTNATTKSDAESRGKTCKSQDTKVKIKGGTFNWNEDEQGMILGAFFPGYVITHIPGGFASDVFGGKHVLAGGMLICGILSALTPLAIAIGGSYGSYMLAAARFVMGASQGALFPATNTLLAKWIPKRERGTVGTLVLTGPQVGSFAGNLISAFLIALSDTWAIVFYFWGIMGIIWYVFFIVMCFSEPADHPFITPEEKEMLNTEIGPSKRFKIPWKKLFFALPCAAITVGQIGHAIVFFFFVTMLPKYLKDVLKFNIKENGIVNALPYVGLWICGTICAVISDRLINNGTCSVVFIRRLFTTIASVGPSVCVVGAGYLGCDRVAASAMFIIGLTFMGPFYPGLRVNAMDITKNFAGLLTAISNGAGALVFAPVPNLIGRIAKDKTVEQWQIVFWIIFVLASITNVLYWIWASGERADWDIDAEEN